MYKTDLLLSINSFGEKDKLKFFVYKNDMFWDFYKVQLPHLFLRLRKKNEIKKKLRLISPASLGGSIVCLFIDFFASLAL